ncbi:DUF167 domain-containing protein [bacterium]|nr:DUF167 domain-containing protein [bacterium]
MVKLTPRSSEDAVLGWSDGILRVRVKAPPVDGRANRRLIEVLAESSGRPKAAFMLVGGTTSRLKRIRVRGG